MIKSLNQSSLRDYLNCQYKYKLKYMDNIHWFQGELKNSFDLGNDFHIIAQRYFLGIETEYIEDENLQKWYKDLKKFFPIDSTYEYLPEYELRYNELGLKLMAKYDLLILKPTELIIVDWKTNKAKLNEQEKVEDIQTKVYLFILANCLSLFPTYKYSLNNIKMIYWQGNYIENAIEINYSFEKNLKYKEYLLNLVEDINNSNFIQNKKHCNYCEFNVFCNK